MPQVKVYGLRSALFPCREQLSSAIHQALMSTLKTPAEKRFQRFMWLGEEDFIFPDDRTTQYTIIEISMFSGRTLETRQALIRELYRSIDAATPITPQDLEITLFETPAANWGIRGTLGNELKLDYKISL